MSESRIQSHMQLLKSTLTHDFKNIMTAVKLERHVFSRQLPAPVFKELFNHPAVVALEAEFDRIHGAVQWVDGMQTLNPETMDAIRRILELRVPRLREKAKEAKKVADAVLPTISSGEHRDYLSSYFEKFSGNIVDRIENLFQATVHAQGEQIDLAKLIQTQFSGENIQLEIPPGPVVIMGDPAKLQEALLNLASNAEQHPRPGVPAARKIELETQGHHMFLRVIDNGKGIPPRTVRDLNWGLKVPSTRQFGSGVGTDVVRNIVRLHGGSMHYESTYQPESMEPKSVGTTVTLRLPLLR